MFTPGAGTPFDQLVAEPEPPAPEICPTCQVPLTKPPEPDCPQPEHWLHYGR